ncbi:MAG TPA: N-acetylmuramic acid 6-phosphate etherase [Saprospiraceae bacterium]|nr:N-acetylmuramic acid 6-phosphate etherase [Saprospiraceae bacterium]HMQ85594.1 N-acetylmuramic acid 6-phosphate etherase [Saprospiraceae bacterium]
MQKITEQPSPYRNLEQMPVEDILRNINAEDKKVAFAVEQAIPLIAALVEAIIARMKEGGRLFYIGAGTSGRLGILDASECPPTYGVPEDWVIGIIAGGETAIRRPVEAAEDSPTQAWLDLQTYYVNTQDVVLGIAASGTTPYVEGGLRACRENGILTASLTCNPDSPVAAQADYAIEVVVGPEFVTGSTRMKSGTAQKMVLNMISTGVMIGMGRVLDNRMVDMQLSNQKLVDRGAKMLVNMLGLPYQEARQQLLELGSVRAVLDGYGAEK